MGVVFGFLMFIQAEGGDKKSAAKCMAALMQG